MAILPNIFNPAFYEGGTSGVLGNLPMYFTQPGASQGFPDMPTGGLRPPMAAPQAPLGPPMSAMPEAPAAQPSIFSRFMSGINDNSDLLMGIGAGLLQGKGLGGGLQMGSQFAAAAGKRNVTDDIKEFEYARAQGFKGTLQDWMQRKRAGAGEYGMQPIWGVKNGKPALVQLGKSGQAIESQLPEGFEIARDPIKVEGPTGTTLLDSQTRQVVGFVPKNVQEAAAAKERGEIQGQAQGTLPAAEITANRTIKQIDEFMASPGFNEVFGKIDQYRPNWLMTEKGADALTRFNQLSGRAFLEGREMLKGGGAITDFESRKAELAIVRLERSLSEADAKAALGEFKDAVREGAAKLRAKAAGGQSAPAAAPSPAAAGGAADPLGIR